MWKPVVKSSFVSIKEILVFSIIIATFLVYLFPKGKIEKLVTDYTGQNILLANIYLENLVRIKPDPELKFLLAKRSLQLGNTKRAEEILKELENTDMVDRVLFLRYERLKIKYFSNENMDKKQIYHHMERLLDMSLSNSKSLDMMENIYREAVSMSFHRLALISAVKISNYMENKDIHWLKKVYQHAVELQDYKVAIESVERLKILDAENYVFWLQEEYKLGIAARDPDIIIKTGILLSDLESKNKDRYKADIVYIMSKRDDYEKIISRYKTVYPSKSQFLLDVLVELYTLKKQYDKAIKIYMDRYINAQDLKQKDEYYERLINLLLANQKFEILRNFIKSNYHTHISNPELAKLSLKAALASGDTDTAYMIAKDIKEQLR